MKGKRAIAAAAAFLMLCGCSVSNTQTQTQTETVTGTTTAVSEASESSGVSTADEAAAPEETAPANTVSQTDDSKLPEIQETEPADAVQQGSYKDAYKTLLRGIADEQAGEEIQSYMFSLCDVGGDSTPELLVSDGEYHISTVEIYTFRDGEAKDIGSVGSYGYMTYIPSTRMMWGVYGGMGTTENVLYEFNGETLEAKLDLYSYEGVDYSVADSEELIEEYRIQGEDTTKDEYNKCYEENFSAYSFTLGRHFYVNEYGISAVFDDNGPDTAYDLMIRSIPSDDGWGRPDKMAIEDLDGSGTFELILNKSTSIDIFTYDGGVRYCGYMPTYDYTPYKYFSTANLELDYGDKPSTCTMMYDSAHKRVVWRILNTCEDMYVSELDNGVLLAAEHYESLKLSDGSYVHIVNGEQVEEFEYDSKTQGYFSDGYKEVVFYPVAVE